MLKLDFLTFILVLCLAGTGCDRPNPSATPGSSRSKNETESGGSEHFAFGDQCLAPADDAFDCVRKACSRVGGAWDEERHSCSCPSTRSFFSAMGAGICVRPDIQIPDQTQWKDVGSLSVLGNASFSLVATDPHWVEQGLPYSDIQLQLGRLSRQELDWMESNLSAQDVSALSRAKLPVLPGTSYGLLIISGRGPVREKLLENLSVPDLKLYRSSTTAPVLRVLWEPDPRRWISLITRESRSEAPFVLRSDSSWNEWRGAAAEVWQAVSENAPPRVPSSAVLTRFTQNGCAGHCITGRDFSLGMLLVSERVEWGGGVEFRHQLRFSLPNNDPWSEKIGVIEIDPTGAANVFYWIEVTREGTDLIQDIQVESARGEVLIPRRRQVLQSGVDAELKAREEVSLPATRVLDSVVMCEGGFAPTAAQSAGLNVTRGPRGDASFWGWENPVDELPRLKGYLSGFLYLGENLRLNRGALFFARHSLSVGKVLTQDTDLRLIPVSVERCFESFSQWSQPASKSARVVNLSASLPYDSKSCAENDVMTHAIQESQGQWLWVASAGNDSRKDLKSTSSLNCPQNLGSRSNLITVAAYSEGDGALSDYADSGADFADIAAADTGPEGLSEGSPEKGSSFAAPRVSRVAALIAQQFPVLAPDRIRAAILLSARAPSPFGNVAPLPVRSGGVLDGDGALQIAKILSQLEGNPLSGAAFSLEDAIRLLTSLRCRTQRECSVTQKQLVWLERHDAFPSTLKGDPK